MENGKVQFDQSETSWFALAPVGWWVGKALEADI